MDILKEKSAILLQQQGRIFQRDLLHQINWNNHLIGILGERGAGKTTLMLQRMSGLKARPNNTAVAVWFFVLNNLPISKHRNLAHILYAIPYKIS